MAHIRLVTLLLAVTLAAAGCTVGANLRRPASSAPSTPPSYAATSPAVPVPSTPGPSTTRTTASVPPVPAGARAVGLVDIRTVVPDAIVDLRYATTDNFTGVRLYPADARCLVHRSMVHGLRIAAARLRREGYRLVFWDCYRPHSVQVRMFRVVPNPAWVARPGPYSRSHETGRSVDVTLATAATGTDCPRARTARRHCLLDMGTGFDDFTSRAYAYATAGLTSRELADRALLRTAMGAGGLSVYSGEWWHFDGPGADVERPIVNAPLA